MSGFVEVLPPERTGPEHPEWFEARRAGVTASEIAAVLGLSPWESPFSLYWRKRGVLGPPDDNDGMRWGRRLEPVVLEHFEECHPDLIVTRPGLLAHRDRPWQMASLDGLALSKFYDSGPVAVVEAKTTESWESWGAELSDEIPSYYRAQVLWQMDVAGVEEAWVPVAKGRQYREYVVFYDEADCKFMREQAEEFLERLRTGNLPDVDGAPATIDTLRRLNPQPLDDEEVRVPETVAQVYRRAVRNHRKAEDRKRLLEARLRQRMGRARVAVDPDGEKVATRSIYPVKEHVRPACTVDKLSPAKEKT